MIADGGGVSASFLEKISSVSRLTLELVFCVRTSFKSSSFSSFDIFSDFERLLSHDTTGETLSKSFPPFFSGVTSNLPRFDFGDDDEWVGVDVTSATTLAELFDDLRLEMEVVVVFFNRQNRFARHRSEAEGGASGVRSINSSGSSLLSK